MDNLIDSMTGPASWPFWIGINFGLLLYAMYALTKLLSWWRERRQVKRRFKRLNAPKDYEPPPQAWEYTPYHRPDGWNRPPGGGRAQWGPR